MNLASNAADLWWSPDRAGICEALANHDDIFGRVVEASTQGPELAHCPLSIISAAVAAGTKQIECGQDHKAGPQGRIKTRGYHRALLLFMGDVEGYIVEPTSEARADRPG